MQNRFILDYVQNIKYEGYSNPQYHKRGEGINVFVFFFTFLIILGKKVSRFRMSKHFMVYDSLHINDNIIEVFKLQGTHYKLSIVCIFYKL